MSRILNNHSDYNRVKQRKVGNVKTYGGVSMYIAQRQAKKKITDRLKTALCDMTDCDFEPIKNKIGDKCLKVKRMETINKWLNQDIENLVVSMGVSSYISKKN